MKTQDLVSHLCSLGACAEPITWAKTLPENTTPEQAWNACLVPGVRKDRE